MENINVDISEKNEDEKYDVDLIYGNCSIILNQQSIKSERDSK